MVKKSRIKARIKEVKPKLKEIGELTKSNSDKERMVLIIENHEGETISDSSKDSSDISLLVNPTSPARQAAQTPEQINLAVAEDVEREQEMRRLYSGTSYQKVSKTVRDYEISPTSSAFVLKRQRRLSSGERIAEQNPELAQVRSEQQESPEERYKIDAQQEQEKSKRRYPWEA